MKRKRGVDISGDVGGMKKTFNQLIQHHLNNVAGRSQCSDGDVRERTAGYDSLTINT